MIQEGNEVLRRALMIDGRVIVIVDAKIRSGLQPQIVWFTWVVEVVFSIRGYGKERLVDIGCGRAILHVRPVVILHHNEEDCLSVCRSRSHRQFSFGLRCTR